MPIKVAKMCCTFRLFQVDGERLLLLMKQDIEKDQNKFKILNLQLMESLYIMNSMIRHGVQ